MLRFAQGGGGGGGGGWQPAAGTGVTLAAPLKAGFLSNAKYGKIARAHEVLGWYLTVGDAHSLLAIVEVDAEDNARLRVRERSLGRLAERHGRRHPLLVHV